MEKKYQTIRDKVLKGTKRAIDKLVIESEKTGRPLVVSNNSKKIEVEKKS